MSTCDDECKYSLTPPRSRDVVTGDAKTGPELRENVRGQAFGHDVGELLPSGDVKDAELAQRHALANEVDVELHVLRPAVVHWVGGEVDGGHVVAEHQRGLVHWSQELAEELTEPDALGDGVGDAAVFGLRTGAGHRRLALGGPGDERVAEVDDEAGRGTACVGAARLVSIGEGTYIECGRGAEMETEGRRAVHVPQHTLDQSEMALARGMHVQADLLDGVGELGAGDGEVLQASSDASVGGRVVHTTAISRGQLGLGVNGRRGRTAGFHAGAIDKLFRVLFLAQEEAGRRACHANAEEEVEIAEVLHRKFTSELGDDALKNSRRRGGEHDAIHVEEEERRVHAAMVDEQRRVGAGGHEAHSGEEAGKAEEPGTWGLFQPVQRLREPADMVSGSTKPAG